MFFVTELLVSGTQCIFDDRVYFVFANYPVVVVKSIRMIKMFTVNVSTEAYNLIV